MLSEMASGECGIHINHNLIFIHILIGGYTLGKEYVKRSEDERERNNMLQLQFLVSTC